MQLRDGEGEIHEHGGRLIVVGNGKPWHLQGFREKTSYKGALYTDPSLSIYRRLKLKRGPRSSFRLRAVAKAVAAHREGFRQTRVKGDAWQQGGCFVVDQEGRLCFEYPSEHAGDHPPLHLLLRGLDVAAGR